MSRSQPLVSVVIPIYNVERYIATAISSVLLQSYQHFELLLIDDASPDNSIAIAQTFIDPRIKIISQSNLGLAGARNTGLHAAKGKYIALLDADDLWHPCKLAMHVNHLELKPNVDVSYCPSLFIDQNSKPLGLGQYPKLHAISPQDILCRNPVGNGSAAVIRARLLEQIKEQSNDAAAKVNFFDQRLRQSEDIEFWLRIALSHNACFEGIAPALTYYRLNQQGLSANLEQQLASWQTAMSFNRQQHPEFFAKYFSMACAYQYRYLARRAIHSNMPSQALYFSKQALQQDMRIILQEPSRTLLTHLCAWSLYHFTKPFNWLSSKVLSAGQNQCR